MTETAARSLRVGACPGAWRPMASRDGLILRVKPRGARLPLSAALGLAEAAGRFGSGIVEVTGRANLQLRGVDGADERALRDVLWDFALLDPTPQAEARRTVVTSPLAGLDRTAAFDISPAVAALEDALAGAEELEGLPDKFGFAASDGGLASLEGVPADVRLDARRDAAGTPGFALRLDGDARRVAACRPADLPATALALARAFLTLRRNRDTVRRMRDLVGALGAAAIFAEAGLAVTELPSRRAMPRPALPLGLVSEATTDEGVILGLAAPFGRIAASALASLVRSARATGAGDLRVTPWRMVLVTGLDRAAGEAILQEAGTLGFMTHRDDPRLAIATCVGAPHCWRATTPTLTDAALLTEVLGPQAHPGEVVVHVSGCAKGCAHPGTAPVTLVGRDGAYDLVRNGRPTGAPLAKGLGIAEARRMVRAILAEGARP